MKVLIQNSYAMELPLAQKLARGGYACASSIIAPYAGFPCPVSVKSITEGESHAFFLDHVDVDRRLPAMRPLRAMEGGTQVLATVPLASGLTCGPTQQTSTCSSQTSNLPVV